MSTIHQQILARRAEVQQLLEPLLSEAEQLKNLVAAFADDAPPPVAAAGPARSTRRRANASRKTPTKPPTAVITEAARPKRGRPSGSGNRTHQAVALIAKQPGITASELATSMGISPNYLYRVLPRLQKEAKITKHGKGYRPAGAADATAATDGQPVTA